MHLIPALKGFMHKHPELRVDLMLSDTIIDLVEGAGTYWRVMAQDHAFHTFDNADADYKAGTDIIGRAPSRQRADL